MTGYFASTHGRGSSNVAMAETFAFTANAAGVAALAVKVGVLRGVAATATGVSSTTQAVMHRKIGLLVLGRGIANATNRLTLRAVFSVVCVGRALTTGHPTYVAAFSQVSRGVGSVRGRLSRLETMAGSTFGHASDFGYLGRRQILSGLSGSMASTAALISRIRAVIANAIGSSSATNHVASRAALTGSATGTNSASLYVLLDLRLTGQTAGSSGSSINLSHTALLEAITNGRASTRGSQVGVPQAVRFSITAVKAADMALNVVEVA